MTALLFILSLAFTSSAHAQGPDISACEAALQRQSLDHEVAHLAAEIARAVVQANDFIRAGAIGPVRLLVRPSATPHLMLIIEAAVEVFKRPRRFVRLELDRDLHVTKAMLLPAPSETAAPVFDGWHVGEPGSVSVAFAPPHTQALAPDSLAIVEATARRYVRVVRKSEGNIEVVISSVTRTESGDARARVTVRWMDQQSEKQMSLFVVARSVRLGFTSEDDWHGEAPNLEDLSRTAHEFARRNFEGDLVGVAIVQEGGLFFAHVQLQTQRKPRRLTNVLLSFHQGADGRVEAHQISPK